MRQSTLIQAVTLVAALATAAAADVRPGEPFPQIDRCTFERLPWVPRALKKEPAYKSGNVRYCIWVLGNGRKSVMTLAWDESGGTGSGYDTLYADRNFNRDLTEEGERLHYPNVDPKARGRKQPLEQYDILKVKEADGDKVFDLRFRNVYKSDAIEYDSSYRMRSPKLSYDLSPLPHNHHILWSNDLKTAPVYRFGGEALPIANGKRPGESLGIWEAGRQVSAAIVCSHFGDPPEARLHFYGAKVPGPEWAKRSARWGRAAYPTVLLRTFEADGSVIEEIPFGDDCHCAGGFNPDLLIPSRVPPGEHKLVVRMVRLEALGGPAEFIFPVNISNPDYGKPMEDPARSALKAKFPDATFATLRRADSSTEAAAAYPGERVVPARVFDNTMDPTNRDWDPRPISYGRDRMLKVGTSPHCHADSRTLMRFDLSGVPKETTILGAQLRLTTVSGAYLEYAEGTEIQAYAMRRPWNEARVGNKPWSCWHGPMWFGKRGTKWGKGGADDPTVDRYGDVAGTVDVGGFPRKLDPNDKSRNPPVERRRIIALDVSGPVKRWHAGEMPNHGLLLKLKGKGNGRICSSEFLDYPHRPALVIAFRGPLPKPAWHAARGSDLAAARAEAKRIGRLLALKITAPTCVACYRVERTTYADKRVQAALAARFVTATVRADRHRELIGQWQVTATPSLVILNASGGKLAAVIGSKQIATPDDLLEALEAVK